jgi:hypothetical protein
MTQCVQPVPVALDEPPSDRRASRRPSGDPQGRASPNTRGLRGDGHVDVEYPGQRTRVFGSGSLVHTVRVQPAYIAGFVRSSFA